MWRAIDVASYRLHRWRFHCWTPTFVLDQCLCWFANNSDLDWQLRCSDAVNRVFQQVRQFEKILFKEQGKGPRPFRRYSHLGPILSLCFFRDRLTALVGPEDQSAAYSWCQVILFGVPNKNLDSNILADTCGSRNFNCQPGPVREGIGTYP